MTAFPDALVSKYRDKGVFVDTNILLLWFVGAFDRTLIERFKRTRQFMAEDFDTLDDFLRVFSRRATIPNVLTEVSNLAANLGDRAEFFFTEVFSKAVTTLDEHYVPSVVADGHGLPKFGLTDACIMALVKDKYLLLTDDFRLSQYFASIGGDAINFNHIRVLRWT